MLVTLKREREWGEVRGRREGGEGRRRVGGNGIGGSGEWGGGGVVKGMERLSPYLFS